jgi:hypothetical protein
VILICYLHHALACLAQAVGFCWRLPTTGESSRAVPPVHGRLQTDAAGTVQLINSLLASSATTSQTMGRGNGRADRGGSGRIFFHCSRRGTTVFHSFVSQIA